MLSVKYNARNFDSSFGKLLQGDNSLTLKWQDLVWSAITVGKRGYFELSSHKMSSIYEIAHRTFGVYAYLSDIGGYICRSDLYDSLDSTEKGGVSYSTGMMMAKLFSSKLLNTPWLIHLEKIDQSLFMLKGRSRPDLVGLTRTGDWIVVEAKGRTNGFSHMAQLYANDQTRKLRKISGKLPLVRVAIQSYFDNTLQVKLEDPDDYDNNAVDVKIDINDYINTFQ